MLRPGRGSGGLPSYGSSSGGYGSNGSGSGWQGSSSSGPGYGGYKGNGSPANGYSYGGGGGSSYKDKPRRGGGSSDVVGLLLDTLKRSTTSWVAGLIALFLFFYCLRLRSQQSWLLAQLGSASSASEAVRAFGDYKARTVRLEREVSGNKAREKTVERQHAVKYQSLERENRKLQKERDELRVKYESPERRNEELRMVGREEAWKKQVQLLQKATIKESRRAVTDKFGPGPHRVEMSVLMPEDDDQAFPRKFVVEMAPLASMPHSVHLFLEQVDHGLWNNAWFYINGPHVLQGGPAVDEEEEEEFYRNNKALYTDDMPEEDAERLAALQPFRALQLETLAFPEYSEDFPHVPWTLGYTGRPGGPDWYINKGDNTAAHGPGGQYQHDLEEFADPCFAKVVQGFDVLKRVFKTPTITDDEDYEFFLEEPIHIVGARVISPRPQQQQQQQVQQQIATAPQTTTATAAGTTAVPATVNATQPEVGGATASDVGKGQPNATDAGGTEANVSDSVVQVEVGQEATVTGAGTTLAEAAGRQHAAASMPENTIGQEAAAAVPASAAEQAEVVGAANNAPKQRDTSSTPGTTADGSATAASSASASSTTSFGDLPGDKFMRMGKRMMLHKPKFSHQVAP